MQVLYENQIRKGKSHWDIKHRNIWGNREQNIAQKNYIERSGNHAAKSHVEIIQEQKDHRNHAGKSREEIIYENRIGKSYK